MIRNWDILYIVIWKSFSPYNGTQFFIFYLVSWLCTRRFSELTFRPSGATNYWKNIIFRDFPGCFSYIWNFFFLIFYFLYVFFSYFLWFFLFLNFYFSILLENWFLNFYRLLRFWWQKYKRKIKEIIYRKNGIKILFQEIINIINLNYKIIILNINNIYFVKYFIILI